MKYVQDLPLTLIDRHSHRKVDSEALHAGSRSADHAAATRAHDAQQVHQVRSCTGFAAIARMEQEFRTAGLSSMVAGLVLGNVSYISLSPSRLNRDAGGHDRSSGALSGALCLVWILVGPKLTGYVPKFVVGGLESLVECTSSKQACFATCLSATSSRGCGTRVHCSPEANI